jgi:hypothetical protein
MQCIMWVSIIYIDYRYWQGCDTTKRKGVPLSKISFKLLRHIMYSIMQMILGILKSASEKNERIFILKTIGYISGSC